MLRINIRQGRNDPFATPAPPQLDMQVDRWGFDAGRETKSVTVTCGSRHFLDYHSSYPDDVIEKIRAEVDAYNADPAAGWAELLEDFGIRSLHAETVMTNEAMQRATTFADRITLTRPFEHLSIDSADERVFGVKEYEVGKALAEHDPNSYVSIYTTLGNGQKVLLFDSASEDVRLLVEVADEVSRFNASPRASYLSMLRASLYRRSVEATADIQRLLEEQVERGRRISDLADMAVTPVSARWTHVSAGLPADGTLVDVICDNGDQRQLLCDAGSWFNPNGSPAPAISPIMWKGAQEA